MDLLYTMKHRRLLILAVLLGIQHMAHALESCEAVKRAYARQGFKGQVPEEPISGDHLKMCSGSTTCCTETMESKLSIGSRLEFDNNLKKNLNPLANLLDKKNTKFDEFFRNLLNHSRTSFDTMFVKTYGILYKQNAHVFTDLYDNLEDYYNKGQLDLQEAMNGFFEKLYQRMFAVYNSQYQFTPKYLRCITRHMEELQPFGDVPVKLTTQIKRSFVALRTFVQGLATGRDVVRNVLKVNPSLKCVHELMKMSQCAMCAGELGVHPCMPYCLDVIHHCLAHHKPLVQHWHAYVDAMVQVGERLENPFNIENVVEPIDYKVSDAIMNFQEAGHEISKKVFTGCGQPQLGGGMRNKRQVSSSGGREISFESLDFTGSRQDNREQNTDTIVHLVHEIKTKIKNSRNFWDELPTKMCSSAGRRDDSNCWTGSGVRKYESKGDSGSGFNNSASDNSQMNVQIMRLTVITEKLKEAYNGRDVSWINEAPPYVPEIQVLSTTNRSIEVKLKPSINDTIPIHGYTIYYKAQFGDWESVQVSPSTTEYTLEDLACGSQYNVYASAYNKIGSSESTEILTPLTAGNTPEVPEAAHFIEEYSTVITFKLDAWGDGGCPINYFVLEYKSRNDDNWIIESNHVRAGGNYVIMELTPATFYELRITAHNNAGSSVFEHECYTLTSTGGKVSMPMFLESITHKTVRFGEEVILQCSVDNLKGYKVAWMFNETRTVLTLANSIITWNPRFSMAPGNDQKHWNMKISDVQPEDRGSYMCQVNTDPMMSQTVYLDVQDVEVSSGPTEVIGVVGPERATMGQKIQLMCKRSSATSEFYSLKWYKDEREIFRYMPYLSRPMKTWKVPGISIDKDESNADVLVLQDISKAASGSYKCELSLSEPTFRTSSAQFDLTVEDM